MSETSRKNFDAYLEQQRDRIGSVIHDLWISKDASLWEREPYFYAKLAGIADGLGQVMFAHDVLAEGLSCFHGDLRLTQLFSLSSIKCGFLLKAKALLSELYRQGHRDEETLGILGRVYKEIWQLSGREPRDGSTLKTSRNLYLKAFKRSRGYYSGINAATLSFILGDGQTAKALAAQVARIALDLVRKNDAKDPWLFATLGEACVLLGKSDQALRFYRSARGLVRERFAELASMRRQLRLLSGYSAIAGEVLDGFRIPPIVAFTGHRIDQPGRRSPRFPLEIVEEVGERIAATLEDLGARIGYSSAACGADVLFLEALQRQNGECNVVLPFDRGDFLETSVAYAGKEWSERAEKAIVNSAHVEQSASGSYGGDDLLFAYANRIIMGKAILRSRFLETEPVLLAVWNGNSPKETGGTADFVARWKELGYPCRIIEVGPFPRRRAEIRVGAEPRPRPRASGMKRVTVSMLFADLAGYSRLTEEQIPAFVDGFLGTAARRLKRLRGRTLFKNLWGDAFYFVFEESLEAAEHALALRDMMRETDWSALDLPADLAMRIGLHAGPVFRGREDIVGRTNFFGFHTNLAARIEPITNPGNVYASEQFAALLATNKGNTLDCRYVGVVMLPKNFGNYPIYHVKRTGEIE